jgi:hypothetical protein
VHNNDSEAVNDNELTTQRVIGGLFLRNTLMDFIKRKYLSLNGTYIRIVTTVHYNNNSV